MSKIRILYILHGLGANGIEMYVLNLLRNIDRDKFEPACLLAVDKDAKQFYDDEMSILGVPVYRTSDLDTIKKKFRCLFLIYQYLKKNQFDIVHSHMDLFGGLVLMVAWLAGVKVRICHAHTISSPQIKTPVRRLLQRTYRFFMKKLIFIFATKKIGCSVVATEYLYGHNSNGITCYNGINLQQFHNVCEQQNNLVKKTIKIIAVGRISYVKNAPFIVEIMRELSILNTTVSLVWVGNGEMLEIVKQKIAKYGLKNIELLGTRKDVATIMRNCDYFLLPSLFEGLPISLIEAQASSLDCFISDTIPPEIQCGKCIVLPLKENAAYWASAINKHICSGQKLACDPQKLQRFDIRNTAKQMEDIYTTAVNTHA